MPLESIDRLIRCDRENPDAVGHFEGWNLASIEGRRVASADAPVLLSPVLENADRPDVSRILEAAGDLRRC
jgi:hypothetical protein